MNNAEEEHVYGHRYLFSLACLCGFGLRLIIALHPHTEKGTPPIHGDYESQRHWMEVTIKYPPEEWYKATKMIDGKRLSLDYPPLTAYHSWLMGKFAQARNVSFMEPLTPEGLETPEHKIFMRQTVFFGDVLFFAAIIYYYLSLELKGPDIQASGPEFLLLCAIYPTLILVDHGHFQYHCITLAMIIAAIALLHNKEIVLSSIIYTLAINFKQMSLYHALPFFIYILRLCYLTPARFFRHDRLVLVSLAVLTTFAIIWAPYIDNMENFLSVINRIFPVERGIFENKVGSFWCAFDIFYKLKKNMTVYALLHLCTISTMVAVIPSLTCLYRNPTHRQFLLSLINVSLGFFLFSFQVHERAILLVACPVLLYTQYDLVCCCWFLIAAHISLMHLSLKDNLINPFVSLLVIFCVYLYLNHDFFYMEERDWRWLLLFSPTFCGGAAIFIGSVLMHPPLRYPEFWPTINALFAFTHFITFFFYFNYTQLTLYEFPVAIPQPRPFRKIKCNHRRRRHN